MVKYYTYLRYEGILYSDCGWQYKGIFTLNDIYYLFFNPWDRHNNKIDKEKFARSWNDEQGSFLLFNISNGTIFQTDKNLFFEKSKYRYYGWTPKKRKRRKWHSPIFKIMKYQRNPEFNGFTRGAKSIFVDWGEWPCNSHADKSWKNQTKYRKQWMKRLDK